MEHLFEKPKQLFEYRVFAQNRETSGYLCSYTWNELIDHRASLFNIDSKYPRYLVKPEILTLLNNEKYLPRRLLLDLMWSTGATVSEVLGLKRESFKRSGSVILKRLHSRAGRPTKAQQEMISSRSISIKDSDLKDRIESYIIGNQIKHNQRLFGVDRHTVNRHIHKLVERSGGSPFNITAETFRHSFAVHLMLSGVPQTRIRKLLGLKKYHQIEKYERAIPEDVDDVLRGVYFH